MKTEKIFIIGTHKDSFRSGELSEIIGVKNVSPSFKHDWRLCYEVEFTDGVVDYIPVSEIGYNYRIVKASAILIDWKAITDAERPH